MEDKCIVCGDDIPEGRQVCPKCSGNEGTVFEMLMKNNDVQFEVNDAVEQAFRQGYEEGIRQLEEKHLNECRQISAYESENKRLKELLSEVCKWVSCSVDPICIVWWDNNSEEVMQLIGGTE